MLLPRVCVKYVIKYNTHMTHIYVSIYEHQACKFNHFEMKFMFIWTNGMFREKNKQGASCNYEMNRKKIIKITVLCPLVKRCVTIVKQINVIILIIVRWMKYKKRCK